MMVRLKDIALQAGVSVMTVSKALRDSADISVPTRQKVLGIADRMGYVPDTAARGLRTRRSHLFGMVIPSATDPIHARIILAIEELAHQFGYQVILAHSLNDPARETQVLRGMLSRRVDGVFVIPAFGMQPNAGVYKELGESRMPVVLLGHKAPFCSQFPSVETDEQKASKTITRHLIGLGHRRIAFFSGSNFSISSQARLDGYKKGMREAGIPLDNRLIFHAGSTIEEGVQAALQLLQERPGATAIQAVNDLVAIGAANTLLKQGVKLPAEISITGFGNILTSEHFKVPLTTIRQPKYRLGAAAMEVMQKILAGETVHPRILPGEILIRNSTGPAPLDGLGI